MAQVVVQLINDAGEVENESTLIAGASAEEAERVFAEATHEADLRVGPFIELVVEFHYVDGDVGAYDDLAVQSLWAQFMTGHAASHIVVRPATEQGQLLSNQLHAPAKMIAALKAFVDTINATGGVVADGSGFVPAGDDEWLDLGAAYIQACESLEKDPLIASEPAPR